MAASPHEPSVQDALRQLPAVDHLLNQPAVASLLNDHPRAEVLHAIRDVLDTRRTALRGGGAVDSSVPALALEIRERLYVRAQPALRRVINATGIVLHTGLGRAPLPEEALAALTDAAAGYCNLELDLATGRRGRRHDHVRELLRELTGAEDALVVNNNAAATYLTLHALAAGREVVIARGQLVEIGGSYRLPEIMAASQCRMVEVGTTNRTRISDYERALSADTAILLHVHTSNYRVVGFTESASVEQLAALARPRQLVVVDDLGSGLLLREPPAALATEPTVPASLAAGADLVLFSGDKLLGGPQAGIIVGCADLIARIERDPLTRAVRPDKLTLAALEATLRLYRDPEAVLRRVPTLRALLRADDELHATAEALAASLRAALPECEVTTRQDASEAGGGTLPGVAFPTWVVTVRVGELPAEKLAAALRQAELPVLCRVQNDALVFDPRALDADDLNAIPPALAEAVRDLR
jgi:L-seryl-tRNA(Ser) seleniumtransferase